jgi:hypothetical protein
MATHIPLTRPRPKPRSRFFAQPQTPETMKRIILMILSIVAATLVIGHAKAEDEKGQNESVAKATRSWSTTGLMR